MRRKLLIISWLIFALIHYNNDYMHYNSYDLQVLDKMLVENYKNTHMYLIIKDKNGRIFDKTVSPALYSQSKINDYITLQLREFDIHQSSYENTIYFFGYILFYVLSIVLTLLEFGVFL